MRVRIVSYEDVNLWILGKFARKLNEELLKLGIQSDISDKVDDQADINHHIIYRGYDEVKNSSANDTLMVTHIDSREKLEMIKRQLTVARLGICMSKSTADELATAGIPPEKLCYVDPAHDGVIVPRKHSIGITSKVQPDGCKREDMLVSLTARISPEDFRFTIMGMGWENIIETLRQRGFEVLYHPDFDYAEYVKLMPSLDYYLYLGQDEGSMGFVDALAAGVKTIVTPQGYHLDAEKGIVHSFNEIDELISIFDGLSQERRTLINAVATWTWPDYAAKHLELWRYLLKPEENIHSKYHDGLNSLAKATIGGRQAYVKYLFNFYTIRIERLYHKLKKTRDVKTFLSKLKQFLTGR